jgi:nucleoside-diphosphate-sugar epimerase
VRIFVAGASGVIGRRVVPLLVAGGHEVAGMTRSEGGADVVRGLGAEAVVCDVYDGGRLEEVVAEHRPDLVMHQLTDLPDDAGRIVELRAANARIRREGTRNLLDAARAAGVARFLAQSIAWQVADDGGAAVREMEGMVLDAGGVVLRYGQFYGPGTFHEGDPPEPPRVQIDTAARRTVDALDAPTGVVTIVD